MTAPRLDFYSAGYPCPSFSRMGARRGTNDRRGLVTLQGLHYIATARPRALVLEQVSAITDQDTQACLGLFAEDFAHARL